MAGILTNEEYRKLLETLWTHRLGEKQIREIIQLLEIKSRREEIPRGAGIKLSQAAAQELDFAIQLGESQKYCCKQFNISPTTFKRHRNKLIANGMMSPRKGKDCYEERERYLQIVNEEIQETQRRLEEIEYRPNKKCEWHQEDGMLFAEHR